jgi:hypothetical protein
MYHLEGVGPALLVETRHAISLNPETFHVDVEATLAVAAMDVEVMLGALIALNEALDSHYLVELGARVGGPFIGRLGEEGDMDVQPAPSALFWAAAKALWPSSPFSSPPIEKVRDGLKAHRLEAGKGDGPLFLRTPHGF